MSEESWFSLVLVQVVGGKKVSMKYKNIRKVDKIDAFKKISLGLLSIVLCASISFESQASTDLVPHIDYFDAAFYAAAYPDVAMAYGNDSKLLCNHFIEYGKFEGKFPNAVSLQMAVDAQAMPPVNYDESYDCLFIGNSITAHPACKYWWSAYGMGATSPDMDYVHQVVANLSQMGIPVNYDVTSISEWESRSSIRDQILAGMDRFFTKPYDLIVIQIGDNVSKSSSFETDLDKMVTFCQKCNPDAKIVLVGDFVTWYGTKTSQAHDSIKIKIAAEHGASFADISAIRGKSSYKISYGTKVYGDDGKTHYVRDAGVTEHPNDQGMAYIAEKIIEQIY